MKKNILGLDLGTNSIGWSLVSQDFEKKEGKIEGIGSRIIPMDQKILGDFDKGNSVSHTAERTGYRGVRRLRERFLLRRERLHRILNVIDFLPEHYKKHIDFEKRKGQFLNNKEVKFSYANNGDGSNVFLFKDSYEEMLKDFQLHQPGLVENNKNIPFDWTLFYIRKKALYKEISKEELAWIILNFNQKRGYYQLRGEEEEENINKKIEFFSIEVKDVVDTGDKKGKDQSLYRIILSNGWEFIKPSKYPVDWKGKVKDFIVTTDLDNEGNIKIDKYGEEKRSFRAPKEDDWTLIKKKTEHDIDNSEKSVGEYIYDNILACPQQKIKGKLVRTIERTYYKQELIAILDKQKEYHKELTDKSIYDLCLEELYPHNLPHRNNIRNKDVAWFIVNDIIFYQRPLKSKKSLISGCNYEYRTFLRDGEKVVEPVKCIAKSHPVFQEFRLWQFVKNLRIYERDKFVDGKQRTNVDITGEYFKSEEDWIELFEWLNDRKEIKQDAFLKYKKIKLKSDSYRWNYVEDKSYPCNETKTLLKNRLSKVEGIDAEEFLTKEKEEILWHILYSIDDKEELRKALTTFAKKNNVATDFVELFLKMPPYKKEYAAYSLKAIRKLLPLMRMGKYWNSEDIDSNTKDRINKIIDGEFDDRIGVKVREKSLKFNSINDFKGLPLWMACYVVYNRHSEQGDIQIWKSPNDIQLLKQHSLRNPIVEQVVNETLQVVKDIWQQFGNGKEKFFDEIHVELGREMKNPSNKRAEITKRVQENENTNVRIKEILKELKNEGIEEVRPFSPGQQEILKLYEEGVYQSSSDIPDDIIKIRKNSAPTVAEIRKYKLWLDQGYISPYTGKVIPLSDLFTTKYQIEHVIPQARYFDNSMSNKIVCESEVNADKGSMTGYEYIIKNSGKIIELSGGRSVQLFSKEGYEDHIKRYFKNNRGKKEKLLSEDIPEGFINRQLNDSRYISRVVKGLLSNIVREDNELEATSKHIVNVNGSITSKLKKDWGLTDIWNSIITPRFERLNQIDGKHSYGTWRNMNGNSYFQINIPDEFARGFNKKRIDHRHHALDALVIACTTKDHVSYLNSLNSERTNYSLVGKLREQEERNGKKYAKNFLKPWGDFTYDAKKALNEIVVSFKGNNRVINKTKNYYQKWQSNGNGELKKVIVAQTKGESWAIRKPLHKETVYGRVNLQFIKKIQLTKALEQWENIVDRSLRKKIKSLVGQGLDNKSLKKYFKDSNYQFNGENVQKVEIYYYDDNYTAARVGVDESFNSKKIESITDTGIQEIMKTHLRKYDEFDEKGKLKEHPELAFSQDGLEKMNENIVNHKPIYKVRVFETLGNKYPIGEKGSKRKKYVEAAKGTNLFFAVYSDEEGNRTYATEPLKFVAERQKMGFLSVPETDKNGNSLRFFLSPNDLVYVPNEEELENPHIVDFNNLNSEQVKRVYKVVSFTGNRLYCIQNNISMAIIDKFEYTQLNKMEFCLNGGSIKKRCWKLNTDRLGNIKSFIK